ncbi:3-hydroxyisobutyrate dehydrogenase/2-hydroxy-3-oxopropionate reductase [Stella humosa]|uniref:3-hydroxyisobutyrate dehydrogenase/2-hydroxy-3-oxopropionate reductase n=1 Tax=Stella humosa TaxID=94 RepID=A0A3N1M7B1_9PROT|nr:NAD(P)-dependent oxidoreductase [Stella humosa]ROP99597.1 3-hydroxyisobutyrate dehydrogenase/2-hydroxy-3-oxopropionate reductase [Stella humosa]BBK31178.1 2-hydroxy-3-oxopropionate reductase [Stella humosa]
MAEARRPVAMIGLGIMGSAMSRNMIAAGFTVHGYDPSAAAQAAFVEMGGNLAPSAAAAAAEAEVILTCLPSAAALHAVVADLTTLPPGGRILAETSTLTLDDKEKARLALADIGIVMLDCPLSGSGSQARTRDVLVYGSGPRDAWDCCLPVFQGFSRGPHHLGVFGNGSKMKFVANLLVAIHTVAAGEAFALARKAGLDPQQMFDVVADGAGSSRALQVRGNMLIADRYLPVETMPLDLWRKDLRVIADFATTLGCPTPMFAACAPLFQAAVASGYGDQDTAAVALVLETMAGLKREDTKHE